MQVRKRNPRRGDVAGAPARILAVTTAVALLFSGCTLFETTRAGGAAPPQTIVIATLDPPDRPASDDVEAFARALERESGGSFGVDIMWEAHLAAPEFDPEDSTPETFEVLLDLIRSGEAEIALLPDWAGSDLGVPGIRALKAPFEVTDERVVVAASRDPVAREILRGLEPHGMHGLAMLPETMRHPVSFGAPFLDAGSFAGSRLRTLDPAAVELFAALGADAVPSDGGAFGRDVALGTVQGADSAYAQLGSLPRTGVFTGDVTWFPKVNLLVTGQGWWDGLSDARRTAVDDAAATALDYVLDTNPTDAESAAAYCAAGGSIALAGAAGIETLRDASEPLRAELENDPKIMAVLDRLREIASEFDVSESPVEPCSAKGPTVAAPTAPPGPTAGSVAFPEGSYRAEIPLSAFLDAGVDRGAALDHDGVWTLTFRDGRFIGDCPGSTYEVENGRISVRLGDDSPACGDAAGGELFSAAWTFDGRVLRFVDVRGGIDGPAWQTFHEVLWGSQPWVLVD